MPDDTLPGNFINPDYATPEQLAQLRAYSNYLLQGKGQQEVHRPLQGVSNIVSALVGGYQSHQADELQKQAIKAQAEQLSKYYAPMLMQGSSGGGFPLPASPNVPMSSTGDNITPPPRAPVPSSPTVMGDAEGIAKGIYPSGGSASPPAQPPAGGALPQPGAAPQQQFQPPPGTPQTFAQMYQNRSGDPRALGAVLANPWMSDKQKEMALGLASPQNVEDVYKRPFQSTPLTGQIRSVQTPPGYQPGVRSESTFSPGSIHGTTFNLPPGSTGGAPQANTPILGGAGLTNAQNTMNQLDFNQRRAAALGGIAVEDVQFANQAIGVKRAVRTILDDIETHGGKISFGPQSPWVNDFKRVAANFAPGLMKDQLDGIAAADSIEKMSSNLAGMLSKQMSTGEGSDARLYNAMKSVPGLMNSEKGAWAMAKMIDQTADLQQELGMQIGNASTAKEWQQIKSNFWASHPIKNPLTNNSIQVDVSNAERNKQTQTPQRGGGGWGIAR